VKPEARSQYVVRRPHIAVVCALMIASAAPALAQKKKDPKPDKKEEKKAPDKDKVFDFTGIQFEGRLRTPQLLYFLDRAAEELERASLERRSFMPELVRSVDEESL
jgi:hypothetical protein